MNAVRVRSATAADVASVVPMVQAISDMHEAMDPVRYGFVPHVADLYARWLPKRAVDPTSVFVVAEADDKTIAGFLVAETLEDLPIYRARRYGFVHDLWVEPAWRGRGVGEALARECLARFGAMGVSQVRLDTAAANESARRLYAKLGFTACCVQMAATPARTPA